MKIITLLILVCFITGCGSFGKTKIEYVYQDVYIPVSNIPEPPNTDCPSDAVELADVADSDGELAKAYRIAILQLRDCSKLRQKVLDKYRELAKEDEGKIDNLVEDGPFSASAVTGSTASGSSGSTAPVPEPIVMENPEEIMRASEIKDEFQSLESEFGDLTKKEYKIDEL